jgi:hypothetical protein
MRILAFIKNIFNQLIQKSTQIHHEPINKISIIILIFIDVFVLINVFSGLGSISAWPLTPSEELPCYAAYEKYQTDKRKGTFEFNASTIENIINEKSLYPNTIYPSTSNGYSSRLGNPSDLCTEYAKLEKEIVSADNIKLKKSIDKDRDKISSLNQENKTLQSQYDSSLLEKIAGQSRQKSINIASSEQTKSKIDANNENIKRKQEQIKEKQTKLIKNPASDAYLKLLNDGSQYSKVKSAYQSAEFWYPNKILLLQTLFLLPLIIIAYFWHAISTRKNKGLQALLSWHLLLIFCIPLLIKIFEFLQFGNLVRVVLESITVLLGGLLFIASYGLILIIPLLGFWLIKFLQIFIFNSRVQAKNRIQKVHCIRCNSKLRLGDEFCPFCGFEQYVDCTNCHQKTYKLANFCNACGHQQENQP